MLFEEKDTESQASSDLDAAFSEEKSPERLCKHFDPVDDETLGVPAADAPAALPPAPPESPESEKESPDKPPFWIRCPVTTGFVTLMVLAYVLTTYPSGFQRPSEQALLWGAFIPDAIRAGEWWRFFTIALLHADPAHIAINSFMTLVFGNLLEPALGPRLLLMLYLVSLMGSGAAAYMADAPGIGASGIGYGLIGAYMGFVVLISLRRQPDSLARNLRGLLGFMVLFIASNLMDPHVNLWAHLGGFISGLAFAVALLAGRKQS